MKRRALGFLTAWLLISILVSGQEGRRRITFPIEGEPWCVIDSLVKGGQAEKLHLQPLDIILSVNGKAVHNYETLSSALLSAKDAPIRIEIFRDGRLSSVEGRLDGERLGVYATYVWKDKILPPGEIKADLDVLFASLVNIHPSMIAKRKSSYTFFFSPSS